MQRQKKKLLIIALTIIFGIKSFSKESDLANTTPNYALAFSEEKPARVEKLLKEHKEKGNFSRIIHYYPWEVDPFTLGACIGLLVICTVITGMGGFLIYSACSKEIEGMLAKFFVGLFGGLWLGGAAVLGSYGWTRYQNSKNPEECAGCFCLTDKALLIIRPGREDECVWISFDDVLAVVNQDESLPIFDESLLLEEEIALQQKRNNIKYTLNAGIDATEDNREQMEGYIEKIKDYWGSPYQKENPNRLWIIFKNKEDNKWYLNTDCTTATLGSEENYETLYETLYEEV